MITRNDIIDNLKIEYKKLNEKSHFKNAFTWEIFLEQEFALLYDMYMQNINESKRIGNRNFHYDLMKDSKNDR